VSALLNFKIIEIDYCANTACVEFTAYGTGMHGDESWCLDYGDGNLSPCRQTGLTGDDSFTWDTCHIYTLGGDFRPSVNITPAHSSCLVNAFLDFSNDWHVDNVSCVGNNDGCVNYLSSPFKSSLTYLWSDGQTGTYRCGMSSGIYTLTITDTSGCVLTETFDMAADPMPITANLDTVNCIIGTATISVTGGTTPNPVSDPFSEYFDNFVNGTTSSGPDSLWTSSYQADTFMDWSIQNGMWYGFRNDNEAVFETNCIDVKYCTNNSFSLNVSRTCREDDGGDYFRVYYSCNGGAEQLILDPGINEISKYPVMCKLSAVIPDCNNCLRLIVRTSRPNPSGTCDSFTGTDVGVCYSTTSSTTTTSSSGGAPPRNATYMDSLELRCTPIQVSGYTYEWCNGQTTQSVTNMVIPVCRFTVTDINGCTMVDSVDCNATSLRDEDSMEGFVIYPNPTKTRSIQIKIPGWVLNNDKITVELMEVNGQKIRINTSESNGGIFVDIPTHTPAGMYLLLLRSEDGGIISHTSHKIILH